MKFTYQQTSKERLDKYLQTKLNISRSQIKKIILDGQVKVNQEIPSVHRWLKVDDLIEYKAKEIDLNHPIAKKNNKIIKPRIIKQTEDYLIINKPHGLLVHPTDKKETNTLANWLLEKFPDLIHVGDDPRRPGIVHRLDREVSGLMIIALNQKFFEIIKKQFQERTIIKEYTALAHGNIINNEGEVITPLERDNESGLMKALPAGEGLNAHTTYEVIKRYPNYTLIKVQIKTGRMHQIRAHLYSIGHSIVGDKLYQTKDLRKKKKIVDLRIFLHASSLKFQDAQGQWQSYQSKLPIELEKFLAELK